MTKIASILLGLGVFAAAACGCSQQAPSGESAPTDKAPERAAGVSPAKDATPTTGPRALALSSSNGSAAIDSEILRLQQSLKKLPMKTDFWALLGRAWVRKARETNDPGFYLNAKACADVVEELEPQSRLAPELNGLVFLNEHKFADARDLARKVLSTNANDLLALAALSDASLELGDFDTAVESAQKMVDLKPNLPSYSRASHLRWLAGDTKAAKDIVRSALDARDPKDPEPGAWVFVQAAMIFFNEGDYDGADKGFQKAIDLYREDYAPALVGRGRVAMAKDEPARAAELFAKAYKLSPLVETAWLLGDAKDAAGDKSGAESAYAEVVKRGRQTDGRTLALYYATRDMEHEEAVRLAQAETKVRDDIYTEDTLGWALYRAGKLSEARAAVDKATRLGTKDARLLYHAGAIRIAQGEKDAGRRLVEEALKLNPRFDRTGSDEAKKLLGK
jgi:tetratricopeptide (TPR) repeat protein